MIRFSLTSDSLKQETTEFLTQLSQSLSDENDNLITLVRGALTTMRELLGLPANYKFPDSAIGSLGSNEDGKQDANMLHTLPTSFDTLAADMDSTLAQLKTILTNPNFVSMEEVEELVVAVLSVCSLPLRRDLFATCLAYTCEERISVQLRKLPSLMGRN